MKCFTPDGSYPPLFGKDRRNYLLSPNAQHKPTGKIDKKQVRGTVKCHVEGFMAGTQFKIHANPLSAKGWGIPTLTVEQPHSRYGWVQGYPPIPHKTLSKSKQKR